MVWIRINLILIWLALTLNNANLGSFRHYFCYSCVDICVLFIVPKVVFTTSTQENACPLAYIPQLSHFILRYWCIYLYLLYLTKPLYCNLFYQELLLPFSQICSFLILSFPVSPHISASSSSNPNFVSVPFLSWPSSYSVM